VNSQPPKRNITSRVDLLRLGSKRLRAEISGITHRNQHFVAFGAAQKNSQIRSRNRSPLLLIGLGILVVEALWQPFGQSIRYQVLGESLGRRESKDSPIRHRYGQYGGCFTIAPFYQLDSQPG
jgi:hypothetical protein